MKQLVGFLAVVLLAPTAARGQEEPVRSQSGEIESLRDFYIELHGGRFVPKVDSEATLHGTPYKDIFENRGMWIFGAELDWELWQRFGTLAAGLAVDYANVYGHGIPAGSPTSDRAPDSTSLKTVPIRALAVYRFDWPARRFGIPLVPFGKAGLAYTVWWATKGDSSIPTFPDGGKARGGKWGYEVAGGLALELNFLDPTLAREFDSEFGVNSVSLQAQYARITANNFGKAGIDLTANTWLFGVGFEF